MRAEHNDASAHSYRLQAIEDEYRDFILESMGKFETEEDQRSKKLRRNA